MLLRFDLRAWEAKTKEGERIDFVICSTFEEAAEIVYQVTKVEEFNLTPVNPFTGDPLEEE